MLVRFKHSVSFINAYPMSGAPRFGRRIEVGEVFREPPTIGLGVNREDFEELPDPCDRAIPAELQADWLQAECDHLWEWIRAGHLPDPVAIASERLSALADAAAMLPGSRVAPFDAGDVRAARTLPGLVRLLKQLRQFAAHAGRTPGNADGDLEAFDVFLCYKSDDGPVVKHLRDKLIEGDLRVWFDDESVGMGASFLRDIEKGLRGSSSVAVCVGSTGIGPWQTEEIDAALQLAVREKRLVIPVLLPGARDEPDLPIFLKSRRWVDFRSDFTDEGLKRLIGDIKKASDERHRGTKKQ